MAANISGIVLLSINKNLIETIKLGLSIYRLVSVISTDKMEEAEKRLLDGKSLLAIDIDIHLSDYSYVKRIKRSRNTKIIVISGSPSKANGYLGAGADYFVMKPAVFTPVATQQFIGGIKSILDKIGARQENMSMSQRFSTLSPQTNKVWAIASSTGGTEALEKILVALHPEIPPTVVVQHMPSGFTKLFADRLNKFCPMEVREAKNGDYLAKGLVLLAPADSHMIIMKQNEKLAVNCFVGSKIHGVMPAADVLFESVAEIMQSKAVGVVLTGMGTDGAKGLMQMHQKGARTICQDRETSVVYGMPKAAKELGAVEFELPLDQIAGKMLSL